MEIGIVTGFVLVLGLGSAVLLAVTAARGGGGGPVSEWRISAEEREEMVGRGGDSRA
jgi:hypothetical protein